MSKPVVGAQLYTVREHIKTLEGVEASFKKVREIGYTAVQISGMGPVDPKEVARIAKDTGLTIAATHTGWQRFIDELEAVIEEHQLWGCRHTAIGGLPGDYRSAEGIQRFAEEIGPVAEQLAAAGMDFSYHNHSQELARCNGKTWLETLYDTVDAKHLKAEIDTYWIQAGGGDPAAWIRKYPGREPLVHFKDMMVLPDREQRFAEIGEGNLNWPEILKACEECGVEYLLVEQDNAYGGDAFDCLATSYRNLKAMGYE